MVVLTLVSFALFVLLLVRDIVLNEMHHKENEKLLVTIRENQSWWSLKQNKEERAVTQVQIIATFTNVTDAPIKVLKARMIKPKIKGAVAHTQVIFPQENITHDMREHIVPAHQSIDVTVNITLYGKIALAHDRLKLTIGVTDQENIEHRIKGILKPIIKIDSADEQQKTLRGKVIN